jgi:hypothetical protein
MAHRGQHPSISAERKRHTMYRDLSVNLGLSFQPLPRTQDEALAIKNVIPEA